MLKKLLKHDFISVWRLAFPIFAIATGIVLFAYIMCAIEFENPVLQLFATFLFPTGFIVLIVACVLIFCLPVVHFYRNLMTGEGYLSFTLPVTSYRPRGRLYSGKRIGLLRDITLNCGKPISLLVNRGMRIFTTAKIWN